MMENKIKSLQEKKDFLIKLLNNIRININEWDAKDIQDTLHLMNSVTLEIAQLEIEVKYARKIEKIKE